MTGSYLLYQISIWFIPVVVAVTFHEAAHGFVAHLRGDDTAWRLGRVSFNPLKHIDPLGTVLLPAMLLFFRAPFLFGYAKPVPVNFRALRNPRFDMILVAAAGPAMNLVLAVIAALAFRFVPATPPTLGTSPAVSVFPSLPLWLALNLKNAVLLNVIL